MSLAKKTALWTVLLAVAAQAAPKPSYVDDPWTWQLEFRVYSHPKLIELTLPGQTEPHRYWYMLYTVTNNTGREVEFYPQFDVLTDTLMLTRSEKHVSNLVFEKMRQSYADTIPLLESQQQIRGTIMQGGDNERDGIAIFEDFDPNARSIRLFVSGLSNEVAIVDHPIKTDPETGRPKEILLRKTLMLEYQVLGDALNPEGRVALYKHRDWVMR